MSSVGGPSPFQGIIPDEVALQILSFLDKRDLQSVACTCRKLEDLSKDFQIWKPRTEIEFGKFIAEGAKTPKISWKQTYEELEKSRKTRMESAAKVLQTHVKKTTTDDFQYRTTCAASRLFGLPMTNPRTHYYPTGQTGYFRDSTTLDAIKINVYKST
jgi:hypothetical protein